MAASPNAQARPPSTASSATPSAIETETSFDLDDVDGCAACHGQVVDEWRSSMHVHAHQSEDPIFAAMRSLRMAREGDALAGRCAQCHSPRAPSEPESPVAHQGVSCATCHNVAAIHSDRRGAAAITWNGDTVRGPHNVATRAAPHGTGEAAPWLVDGETMCLTCHGAMRNPQGVETCMTGPEHDAFLEGSDNGETEESAAGRSGERTCVQCHMPTRPGASGVVSSRPSHRSHAFIGPHHLWHPEEDAVAQEVLSSAVAMTMHLQGTDLRVVLRNTTGHAMPTGFPGRMVVLSLRGFDGDGDLVWQNYQEHPMDDPSAVLHRVYVDEAGEPTMPPYGVRIARDTRLRPREERALSWTVPSATERVEVRLLFFLAPPPAAARMGLPEALATPRVLTRGEVTRRPD